MSIVDRILTGGQSSVAGIIKPIAAQFVPQVSKVDESVRPLIGKGRARTTEDEGFTFVASLVGFHRVVRIRSRGEVPIGRTGSQNIEKYVFAVSGPSSEHALLVDSRRNFGGQVFGIAGKVRMIGLRIGEPLPIHFGVELVGQGFDFPAKIFGGGQCSQEHGSRRGVAELDVMGILPSALASVRINEVVPKSIDALEVFERLEGNEDSFLAFFSGYPSPFHADYDGCEIKALMLDGNGAVYI